MVQIPIREYIIISLIYQTGNPISICFDGLRRRENKLNIVLNIYINIDL